MKSHTAKATSLQLYFYEPSNMSGGFFMRKKLIFGTMIMTLVFSSLIMEPTPLRAKTNTVKAVRNYKVLESEDKGTDKQAEKACEKISEINLGKTTVKVGKVGKKTKRNTMFLDRK